MLSDLIAIKFKFIIRHSQVGNIATSYCVLQSAQNLLLNHFSTEAEQLAGLVIMPMCCHDQ